MRPKRSRSHSGEDVATEIQFSSLRSRELVEIARRFAVGSSALALCTAAFLTAFSAYSIYLDHRYDFAVPLLFLAVHFVFMFSSSKRTTAHFLESC